MLRGVSGLTDMYAEEIRVALSIVGSRVPRDHAGVALPVRKRLDHRGPLSVDVSGAWYFITICAEGHKPWVATKWPKNNDGARSNVPALLRVIANWKHWLTARYGIAFQANFWDTRLRDEAHYAEKFRSVCNNPVWKGLCTTARNWRPVIAFDRQSGVERRHR